MPPIISASLCLMLFASYGCQAGVLTKDQIDAMGTASITLLHQTEPQFLIMTERNMIPMQAGLIPELFASAVRGTTTPEGLGTAAQAEERLLDPTVRIQQIIAQGMGERLPLAKIHEIIDAQARTDPAQIRKITNSDLAISIRTTEWGLQPYGFDTSFHKFAYRGEARLIDLRKIEIVWGTTCRYLGDAPKNNRPSLEDFLQERASLLKAELNRASEVCAQQVLEQLFDVDAMD